MSNRGENNAPHVHILAGIACIRGHRNVPGAWLPRSSTREVSLIGGQRARPGTSGGVLWLLHGSHPISARPTAPRVPGHRSAAARQPARPLGVLSTVRWTLSPLYVKSLFALLRALGIPPQSVAQSLGISKGFVALWGHGKTPLAQHHIHTVLPLVADAI